MDFSSILVEWIDWTETFVNNSMIGSYKYIWNGVPIAKHRQTDGKRTTHSDNRNKKKQPFVNQKKNNNNNNLPVAKTYS